MADSKVYSRVNFQDFPSTQTPLNASNLNKLDKGIDDLDNKMIAKNHLKLSNDSSKEIKFGKDSSGNYGYYKDGDSTLYPFKTTHTDTYTYPSGSTGGTYDMGVDHKYRKVNATNVYNKGKTDVRSGISTNGAYKFNEGNISLSKSYTASKTGTVMVIVSYFSYSTGTSATITVKKGNTAQSATYTYADSSYTSKKTVVYKFNVSQGDTISVSLSSSTSERNAGSIVYIEI